MTYIPSKKEAKLFAEFLANKETVADLRGREVEALEDGFALEPDAAAHFFDLIHQRSPEEILARIEEVKNKDIFGTEMQDLIYTLDFKHAKPYLNCDEEEWNNCGRPAYTVAGTRAKIVEYLDFAWEKANGGRGLSSIRSISHFEAWIWLTGDDEFLAEFKATTYEPYGKPQLKLLESRYRPKMATRVPGLGRIAESLVKNNPQLNA